MRALRPFCAQATAAIGMRGSARHTSRATFYDKVKDERDQSESDVEAMFAEFPKSPHAQKVPSELHQVNRNVIDRAETLNYIFLGFSVAGGALVLYYIDPFRSDMSSRPDRSMAAQKETTFGDALIR